MITFFVYCIPLIGYIHITAKELTLKSARKLCLIYSAIVFVVLSAVYALLEQNISANAGAAVIWGYYVNMAIIKRVYLKPRTRPTTQRPSSVVSSSTVANEAEHWKKQYFDLYTKMQQSSLSDSIIDGLSDHDIEQVRQYAEFLKKANARPSSPPPPKSSFVEKRDSDSSPMQPSKLAEIAKSDISDEEKIQKIKQYQMSESQQTNVQYKASPKPGTTKPNDKLDIYDKVGMVIGYVLIAITIFAFFAIFVVLGG